GLPALIDFRHQALEPSCKLCVRRWNAPFALDLQGDWYTNSLTVFEPLNEHNVGRITDLGNVGTIEVLKAKPIDLFIPDHHLPFALISCPLSLDGLLLDLDDLPPQPGGIVHARLAPFAELNLCHPCGPKSCQTIDDNETDEIHDHRQANGQAHGGQPHHGFPCGATHALDWERYTLAALLAYHTVLYRSRRCCRKISASVFIRNVIRNSTMPPRKSVR